MHSPSNCNRRPNSLGLKSRRRLTQTFTFDVLEPRHLLAGISFDGSTGIVTIVGTNDADYVHVQDAGNGNSDVLVEFYGNEARVFNQSSLSEIVFLGLEGDDWFRNDTAIDSRAYGHDGADTLIGGVGVDRFWGGNGADQLFGNDGADGLFGGNQDDLLVGGTGADAIYGEEGDDYLRGGEGSDLLVAGAGNDRAEGESGSDQIYGNDGDDLLVGGEGDDFVTGQKGADIIFGGAGFDRLFGNEDDDELHGGEGNDLLVGDSGDDLLIGDEGDDQIVGGMGDDAIYGRSGNDLLDGSEGDDRMWGDEGNDRIFGGEGLDRIFGNFGNDFLNGGLGNDRLFGNEGRDAIVGGPGNDLMLGDAGADYLFGQDGNDEIHGGDDRDIIRGGSGNDRLYGEDGQDYISGESGDDLVHGGNDHDVLRGGLGDDDIYGSEEDDIYGDDDDGKSNSLTFNRPVGLSNRLTVSFAPDGTTIFDKTSQLFSAFATQFDAQQIQDVILDSFNTWARNGNLDVGLVADSGDAFGTPGNTYGDARFGDVRIGARPMASDVYAIALGQSDFVTGTWAGDILFNSNAQYDSIEQFMAVALHEVGHVLGLKHSGDLDSAMHRFSTRTDLATIDIAVFQDLYGQRQLDSYDDGKTVSNDSLASATEIKLESSGQADGTYPSIIFGDISSDADVDFFKLEAPDNYSGEITFKLVSAGISQLAPRVSLLGKNGNVISQIISNQAHGDLISFSASALQNEGKYFLKVDGGSTASLGSYALITTLDGRNTIDGAFTLEAATGRELLQLDQEDIARYFADPENYLVNDDGHSDDDVGSATELQTENGYALSARYQHTASLLDNADIDTYKFKSLRFDAGASYAMNISVRSKNIGGMVPVATIYDEDGVEIPANIAVNGHGEFVIQLEQVQSDKEYYVSVGSDDLLPFQSGNYELTISYSAAPIVFNSYASGTIDSGTKKYHSLHVAESQMIQFALEAEPLSGNPDGMIWATIYDQNGTIVYQTAARSGERRTANTAFFKPGSYTIEIESAVGSSFNGLHYHLVGIDVGGPQGPIFTDPTDKPFNKNDNGEYVFPDDVVTEKTFVVVDGISSNQSNPPKDEPPTNLFGWYWGLG